MVSLVVAVIQATSVGSSRRSASEFRVQTVLPHPTIKSLDFLGVSSHYCCNGNDTAGSKPI